MTLYSLKLNDFGTLPPKSNIKTFHPLNLISLEHLTPQNGFSDEIHNRRIKRGFRVP